MQKQIEKLINNLLKKGNVTSLHHYTLIDNENWFYYSQITGRLSGKFFNFTISKSKISNEHEFYHAYNTECESEINKLTKRFIK